MPGPYIAILPRACGPFGWTSVYYPVVQSLSAAADAADTINDAELGLLPETVTVPDLLRVSDVTVFNDSMLRQASHTTGQYKGGTAPVGNFDPNQALGIKFGAGDLNRATKYLRGLPVNLCNGLGRNTFTPDQEWGNNEVIYENAITNKFGILHRKIVQGQPPAYTLNSITVVIHFFVNAPVNLSIRRAGRPFGLPRGRARAG